MFAQLSANVLSDLLDSIIVDVASECHRIARLGLDRNLEEEEEELRLSAQARAKVADPSNSGETTSKYVVDIFGQSHPSVANEVFDCMNCGRSIVAGRFAPHLEKCMGKVAISSFAFSLLLSTDSNSTKLLIEIAFSLYTLIFRKSFSCIAQFLHAYIPNRERECGVPPALNCGVVGLDMYGLQRKDILDFD